MATLLFVDSCVNWETSRTERLACELVDRLVAADPDLRVEKLALKDAGIVGLTEETLAERTRCCESGDFSGAMFGPAKQLASADTVVFAAPYWDLTFPAMFKEYLEQVCVNGITFRYGEDGAPVGLCSAKKAYYVTTAGGYLGRFDYGFDQVKALCTLYFGIGDVRRVVAEGLDIVSNDPGSIMAEALEDVRAMEP